MAYARTCDRNASCQRLSSLSPRLPSASSSAASSPRVQVRVAFVRARVRRGRSPAAVEATLEDVEHRGDGRGANVTPRSPNTVAYSVSRGCKKSTPPLLSETRVRPTRARTWWVARRVHLHGGADAGEIQTARADVRAQQHARARGGEALIHGSAIRLRQDAVQSKHRVPSAAAARAGVAPPARRAFPPAASHDNTR